MTGPAPGVGWTSPAGFGAGFVAVVLGCALGAGWGAGFAVLPWAGLVAGFGAGVWAVAGEHAITSATIAASPVLLNVRIHFSLPTLWTPTLGHSSRMAQAPHRGNTGRHTFCPQ